MASAAASVDAAGDHNPPEITPADLTSLDPAADPQRNGEPPAPPSGDDGTSAMGVTEIPDPARAECGAKRPRPLPSRAPLCSKCARRKAILRGTDPAPQRDDEPSALPSASASPPLTGTELADPGALGAKKGPPSPTATTLCGRCEFREKIRNEMLLRSTRNREAPAPPPPGTPRLHIPPDADMGWVMRQLHLWEPERAPKLKRRAKERPAPGKPLTAEEERGYRECDVGKKLMRHKWDGLQHKWGGMRRIKCIPRSRRQGAADGGANLLAKIQAAQEFFKEPPPGAEEVMRKSWAETRGMLDRMELSVKEFVDLGDKKLQLRQGPQKVPKLDDLDFTCRGVDPLPSTRLGVRKPLRVDDAKLAPPQGAQKGLRKDSVWEMARFGAISAGRRNPLENTMLSVQKALRVDDAKLAPPPQGPQNPSSSAAARVDVLHDKLAQMTKVLTKVLHEAGVLQVSMKLLRLLCPGVGSSAAAGGALDGNDWGLVEETIDNLVNQTGEGMQDIVKTVIPKVFSKEILYDLIMACVGRYPKLLEDDKGKLTAKKYEQYQKQLDLMVNLTTVYDNDPENFPKIMKLMCKIGGCGPLPSEVIDDISPGLDLSTMEQLYSGMLELLHNVGQRVPC
ncbi:uncharacterized protein [Lolium perenne]|uniref:uncharacterized protein n=1 Tax=Lolium perenne TaxID=4522 RepID=UPI0021F59B6B|nr:uncharacterized protein LOC127335864 [Lolium perenne]